MRKAIFFGLMLLFPGFSFTQHKDRHVAWVHGFGGNHCSLKVLQESIDRDYRIVSIRPEYNTQKGIESSGDEIGSILSPFFDPFDIRNLAIGHSMGGLNLRHTEYSENPLPLGGVITIGTPHLGTAFASNYLNGELDEFTKNMTRSLLTGPGHDPLASAFLYPLDDKLDLPLIKALQKQVFGVEDLIHLFDKGGAFDFLNTLLESAQSIEDLASGSAALEKLNRNGTTRESYVIWGEEESPVHWRFLSSLLSMDCDNDKEGNDQILLDKIDRLTDFYQTMETANRVVCQVAYIITFGLGKKNQIGVCVLANRYHMGKGWLKGSEGEWNRLIGATRHEMKRIKEVRFSCWDELEAARRSNDFDRMSEILSTEDCWKVMEVDRMILVNEPSDGLVTKSSATAMPGMIRSIRAEGANHFELLHSESVKSGIRSILDVQGAWPYTEKKF